jgi:hypothetical protein
MPLTNDTSKMVGTTLKTRALSTKLIPLKHKTWCIFIKISSNLKCQTTTRPLSSPNNHLTSPQSLDFLTHFLPCTIYSYVHSQSQNNRKIHTNFAQQTFKACGRKLPVTSQAGFCQTRSVKLLEIVKIKVSQGNLSY